MENTIAKQRERILIVSLEFLGFFSNGGIARANSGLAQHLAERFDVTILYCNTDGNKVHVAKNSTEYWVNYYKNINIQCEILPLPHDLDDFSYNTAAARSYAVSQYIENQDIPFSIIYGDDYGALLFYSIMARQAGRLPQTRICVTCHSGHTWLGVVNQRPPRNVDEVRLCEMENYCYQHADWVLSPSAYMLDWLSNYGVQIAKNSMVIQNIVYPKEVGRLQELAGSESPVNHLVFFGRLELRKGLATFCDALDRLTVAPKKVTFLGKFEYIDGEHSGLYILRRAKKWNFPIEICNNFNSDEALEYLSKPGCAAVMPSSEDNSPCVILECLRLGIPFIASDMGGGSELALGASVQNFVSPTAASFAEAMSRALDRGIVIAQPSHSFDEIAKQHVEFANALIADARCSLHVPDNANEFNSSATPSVAVCVAYFNQPYLLPQTLAALSEQDYPNFTVVVVDDGSTDPEALETFSLMQQRYSERGWQFLRQENRYLGAARNTAVRASHSKYVCFVDDDNCPLPTMLTELVSAAEYSGVGIVSCLHSAAFGIAVPSERNSNLVGYFPLGSAGGQVSIFNNEFADANSLMDRRLFEELGTFDETYGFACQDWKIFATAFVENKRHLVVPKPLYYYRVRQESMFRTARGPTSFRPIAEVYNRLTLDRLRLVTDYVQSSHHVAEASSMARRRIDAALGLELAERFSTGDPNRDELKGELVRIAFRELGFIRAIPIASSLGTSEDFAQLMFEDQLHVERPSFEGGQPQVLAVPPQFWQPLTLRGAQRPFVTCGMVNDRFQLHGLKDTPLILALQGLEAQPGITHHLTFCVTSYPGEMIFAAGYVSRDEIGAIAIGATDLSSFNGLVSGAGSVTLSADQRGVLSLGEGQAIGSGAVVVVGVFLQDGATDNFAYGWLDAVAVQCGGQSLRARRGTRIDLGVDQMYRFKISAIGSEDYCQFHHDHEALWRVQPSEASPVIARANILPRDFTELCAEFRLADERAAGMVVTIRIIEPGTERELLIASGTMTPNSPKLNLRLLPHVQVEKFNSEALDVELIFSVLPGEKDWYCCSLIDGFWFRIPV